MSPALETILTSTLQYLVPVVLPMLVAGVLWILKSLGSKLSADASSSKAAAVGAKVAHFAELVVQDLDATVKPTLVQFLADGKLNEEEGRQLKELAMARMKALLGKEGLAELSGVLGIFLPQVELYLSGAVEKQVAKLGAPVAPF